MDSQGFGVKFLFAALLGTTIAIFWHAFPEGLAAVGPFARMERRPRRDEEARKPNGRYFYAPLGEPGGSVRMTVEAEGNGHDNA